MTSAVNRLQPLNGNNTQRNFVELFLNKPKNPITFATR